MPSLRLTLAAFLALAAPAAQAQRLDVPIVPPCDQRITEAACTGAATVMRLDPSGDGFLAVRTGPGTGYPMINRITNGTRVGTISVSGPWYGIAYANGRQGWVHGSFLGDHIP